MVFRRSRAQAPADPLAVVDPAVLPPSYRPAVDAARQARAQFVQLVGGLPDGPLRARLGELGARIDAGVLAVWHTATHAASIDHAASVLAPDRVTADLKAARRSGADQAVLDALQARFTATQRLLNSAEELRGRLPLLEARLHTAVAHAAELTVAAPATVDGEVTALAGQLDELVAELDGLRAAHAELG